MNAPDSLLSVDGVAGFRGAVPVASGPDGRAIRARVRAVVKAHGRLLGEPWDAQADHAEKVVGEVMESQGLEAGRLWARALERELKAEIERSRSLAEPLADGCEHLAAAAGPSHYPG
jgi:hypothetical protein